MHMHMHHRAKMYMQNRTSIVVTCFAPSRAVVHADVIVNVYVPVFVFTLVSAHEHVCVHVCIVHIRILMHMSTYIRF